MLGFNIMLASSLSEHDHCLLQFDGNSTSNAASRKEVQYSLLVVFSVNNENDIIGTKELSNKGRESLRFCNEAFNIKWFRTNRSEANINADITFFEIVSQTYIEKSVGATILPYLTPFSMEIGFDSDELSFLYHYGVAEKNATLRWRPRFIKNSPENGPINNDVGFS